MKWLLCLTLSMVSASLFGDEAGAIKRFEQAKRSEPELIAFLKGMPKGGDLHNHVSGAVYSDSMLDAAVAKGLHFDPESDTFTSDATKPPGDRLFQDNALLYKYLDQVSMRGWRGGGQSGHDHFFNTFGRFWSAISAVSSEDRLVEVIGRARAQNLQYMELMAGVSPDDADDKYFENLPDSGDLSKAFSVLRPRALTLLEASRGYLDRRDAEVSRRLALPSVSGDQGPINVRYIWSCNRLAPYDEFFAQVVAGLTLAAGDRRVVALNIVAPEDHPNARRFFDRQMEMIDYVWRRVGTPNITLHAGELTLAISPVESMRNRIRKSIELGHARRIGHGISIAWEDNLSDLLAKMRREGIAAEICLTSNASILGVSGDRHPLRLYRAAGVPVFLNTDDEGVSRSNMTMEWVRAVRDQKIGYRELKEMARNSLEYSFLSGPSLFVNRSYARLRHEFADCRKPNFRLNAAQQKLLARSDKMQIQLRLERAFIAFEGKF